MDVNYGDVVKRYLTERVCLLHVHRFCPSDCQFDDALVSSAIVVFEKRKPKSDQVVAFSYGGTLTRPADETVVSLDELRAAKKWTSLPRRPAARPDAPSATLGDFFRVKRGLATGNNDFFIVPRQKLRELGIPAACVRPILPSPRFLKQEVIDADSDGWPALERQLALIDCGENEDDIRERWPRFAAYLGDGENEASMRISGQSALPLVLARGERTRLLSLHLHGAIA